MNAFSFSFISTKTTCSQNKSNSSYSSLHSPIQRFSSIRASYDTSNTPPKRALSKQHEPGSSLKRSLPSTIFNTLDNFINTFVDPPLNPSIDPKYVLSDNFAPVDELPPTMCEVVKGALPPCLDGAYIRNGPNPQYLPRGPHHLFDGDGMLHSIKISKSKATYCSRYVKTYKYMIEHEAGYPVIPNIFSGFNNLIASVTRGAVSTCRAIVGEFNPNNGIGLANTSLALIGGNLFALCESDLPYTVKLTLDGDIITIGQHNFDGKLVMNMTAHPKTDPVTGEAFAFRYGPIYPYLTYFRINPNGTKGFDVPILSMKRPSFIHDFSITKNYAIFTDTQIGMNPFELILGGAPVGFDAGKVPRIGVIPRYAMDESEMRWFDVPGYNNLHAINSWEEDGGDTIVMIAPNTLSVEHFMDKMDLIYALIEKVKIDLKTGIVTRHPVATRNLDFGVINPAYVGRKNKYVYAGVGNPLPKAAGVVKLDISIAEEDCRDCIVATRLFGPRCFCSEPFFVAKDATNLEAEEDDGYVVCYEHNEITRESRFLVMDAMSPDLDIMVDVKLPRRVPYGFHGIFVKENDLNML